ncbi:hypothetical protein VNO77_02781 [Canavalia gladiata]|uniref:Uncharacterized protein n=1 Tax=Canavalia gladiata TaxID=3824 RepID=A0AAN9RBL0_CANGL
MIAKGDFSVTMMDEPKISMKKNAQKESSITSLATTDLHYLSLQLQHPKPKFLSLSLPNSANSSPLFTSNLTKKKPKDRSIESPWLASTLKQQFLPQEMHLRRSKSCGEGRECAASDEFDLWLVKPSAVELEDMNHDSYAKTEVTKESPVSGKDMETCEDEGFKCSALCLYLPGFGKAKAVKTRKEGSEMETAISRTVSLEKFECGSWASSVLFHEIEGDSMNSYFDLPMELIKGSANDVHAPVTSAFVFDKNLKGVLKTGSSRASAGKSDTSPHQVRFSISSSTSYPASPASCITPRLRKAREDFNAFLEAQSS